MSEIFRRVEKKYLLDEEQYNRLFNRLSDYIEKDKYFESHIGNLYFDTDNNDLIVKSIEKPLFKEKVRARCYGLPNLDDEVFFEIKNKYKGVVGKRRITMKLKDFYNYLDTGSYDDSSQIMKEIDYHLKYYNIKPKIYITYDRHSYKAKDNQYIRITFDSNLRSRRDNLRFELGRDGVYYFDNPHYIMEIKTLGALPLWLTRILNEEKIYPYSFSKYGNIYKKECGVKC